jgi:hypothetical protein
MGHTVGATSANVSSTWRSPTTNLADEAPEEESAEATLVDGADDLVVSLHAIAGIRTEDTMHIHIDVCGY